MSTLEDLDDLDRQGKDQKKDQGGDDKNAAGGDGSKDADMKDADGQKDAENVVDLEILRSSTVDITNRRRMLENELKIMKSEFQRLKHEETTMKDKIKDNTDKIENNRYVKALWCSRGGRLTDSLDNYPTLSGMSSNFWILMWRLKLPRKVLILTWTPLELANLPSSRRLQDRLSSSL